MITGIKLLKLRHIVGPDIAKTLVAANELIPISDRSYDYTLITDNTGFYSETVWTIYAWVIRLRIEGLITDDEEDALDALSNKELEEVHYLLYERIDPVVEAYDHLLSKHTTICYSNL